MLELGLGFKPEARLTSLSFLSTYIRGSLKNYLLKDLTCYPHISIYDFEEEDTGARDNRIVKGKEVVDDDLKKPFKDDLKTPLTRKIIEFAGPEYKMHTNIKLYDGTTDPEDHLSRFSSAANSGEWPILPYEITKIVRKTNESLTVFKERWIVETGFIIGVPKVMKIASFMDSLKCLQLAKHFSDKVPATVEEMMVRLDDLFQSEEAYAQTELPKGEMGEQHHKSFSLVPRKDDRSYRNNHAGDMRRNDNRSNNRGMDIYEGKGSQRRDAPQPAKIFNMIRVRSAKGKKRKSRETTKVWMNTPITFSLISLEDDEPLMVKDKVEGYLVRRVYVDEGATVEVMFEHCFQNLNLRIKARLKETHTDLVGFAREATKPLGKIELELGMKGESLGTPAGRVILFGTISTTIPDTTPTVTQPTHVDTTLTPIEIPTVLHIVSPSPDYTPASPDYSPIFDTESDPSEDPSLDHTPPVNINNV
uniref:Reverse transcriptase domain-containing protein n=1 Tax=Tanacetum cinerariifolium TaxID=118510 RepID=A0A6L2JND7_TANCI|nr:reverse transcriptase domain-containing protein [Tanacetum cinerariifolium]